MRVWTLDERGRICLDGSPYWWTRPDNDLRQFIVDALNEKEQRGEEDEPLTAEERAAIAAHGYGEIGRESGIAITRIQTDPVAPDPVPFQLRHVDPTKFSYTETEQGIIDAQEARRDP